VSGDYAELRRRLDVALLHEREARAELLDLKKSV
jgi:hypothetical protein